MDPEAVVMLCPSCKTAECAEGRAMCFECMETALSRVKVDCEGRAKINTFVPWDGPVSSPYRTKMKYGHRAIRRGE